MKTVLIAGVSVFMSLLVTLFPAIGQLKMADMSLSSIVGQSNSVIVVTGDNNTEIARDLTAYLNENYSAVSETSIAEGNRIDRVYSFPTRILGDKKLSKLLAVSRCVYFYKFPLQVGTPTSFCGLVGNTYTYHLGGSSLDNVFLSFKGNGGSSVNVFNTDGSTCSNSLGWLAYSADWRLSMNYKISCLTVYH